MRRTATPACSAVASRPRPARATHARDTAGEVAHRRASGACPERARPRTRRGRSTPLLGLALGLGLAAPPRLAAADEPLCEGVGEDPLICEVVDEPRRPGPDLCVYGGDHKPHTRNLVGAKALMVTSLATTGAAAGDEHGHGAGGPTTTSGVSVFYERELVPKWLEIEVNVGLIDGAAGLQLPIDLLLKKPFHLHRRVTPYISIGPAIELFPRGDRPPLPGITGGVGAYLWLSRDFGLDIELDYTAHVLSPGLEHVITLGLGPVLHF